MALLPSIVQRLGVVVRKSSPDILLAVSFYNDGTGNFNRNYLSNYLNRTLVNDLLILNNVGDVGMYGKPYAIRVWLDVNKMNSLNITSKDIENAVREQNNEYVVGASNAMPITNGVLSFSLAGNEMLATPEQFGNIIVRQNAVRVIRLKDIATVELAAKSYNVFGQSSFYYKNKILNNEVAVIQVYSEPTANQLETRLDVLKKLKREAQNFPTGLKYHVMFDATQFVQASVSNVTDALRDSFILVGLVILFFLGNYRASLIALVTVPVSVLGSFGLLYLFGFSINTLDLFALILAIGIVVDDAIVVIENIERLREEYPDLTIKEVATLAIEEVLGAIIAICLVLSVVFVPVMFLGGLSGVLYRQFAVMIACTVTISALVAITFTPAISAILLKSEGKKNWLATKIDLMMDRVTNFYLYLAEKIIDRGKLVLLILILVVAIVAGILKIIPLSFIPLEDQGYFMASLNLPSSASLEQTQKRSNEISDLILKQKGVQEVMQVVGNDFFGGGVNTYASSLIVVLKNWDQRKLKNESIDYIIGYTMSLNGKFKDVNIRAFNQPPIRGLGSTGGVEFYLEGRTISDYRDLDKVATLLDRRLMQHKEIKLAYHLLNTNVEQIKVEPDVDKAKFYGVSVSGIYNTLQVIYSDSNINFAYIMQGLIWVIMQADYKFRQSINNINELYVRNDKGVLIPLNSVVKSYYYKSPQMIERFNDYLATEEIVQPNGKYSSGDVMKIITQEVHNLPKGYDSEWVGASYMQEKSQKTSVSAFIFSLSMIYLVLCALYEMWRLPLVVLMGIPFALLGSGIFLLLRSQPNDLYFQISLLALLGLSAKNIILMIEFALKHFNEGNSARDSALYALKIRFRPILMTSITFIVGALPLIFASGAGANAEHSVGTGIIGGMLGSVFIGTMFIPSFFVLIMKNYQRKKEEKENV